MSEEEQDKLFRGQGNICAPALPLPIQIGLHVQSQWQRSVQDTAQALLRLNPFLRPFL